MTDASRFAEPPVYRRIDETMATLEAGFDGTIDAEADAAAEQARRTEIRRRRAGWLLLAGIVVLVPAALLVGAGFWFHLEDRRLAEEALAKALAAGDPLTTEEALAAFYPPSPEINQATIEWSRAARAMEQLEKHPLVASIPHMGAYMPTGAGPLPTLDERGFYDDAMLSKADQFIAGAGEKAIEAAHAARRTGAVARFESDLPLNGQNLIPGSSWRYLGSIAPLLILDAERNAARGNLDVVTEDLLSIVALSEAYAREPSYGGLSDRSDFYRWACIALERMVQRLDFGDERLALLEAAYAKPDFREGLVRAFQAGQCRVVRAVETDERTHDSDLETLRSYPLRGADMALAIENYQELIVAAKVDLRGVALARDEVQARTTALDAEHASPLLPYEMAGSQVRMAREAIRGTLKAEADRQIARTLLACERYRLKHGSWPASLGTLVPEFMDEVPLDVVGYEPLKFRVEGDSVEIATSYNEAPANLVSPPSFPPASVKVEKPQR